jgi:molybdenum cofactor guanylyltransferase
MNQRMPRERVIAAVMAGGRGTRLGEPKPTIRLAGRALVSYPLAALAEAGLDTVVLAKDDTPLPPLDVPIWREPDQPVHPLTGITAALERANGRALLVVACDMPFLTAPLLSHLAGLDVPLAVPVSGGRLHPLLGRYAASLSGPLTAALFAARPLQEVVAELEPVLLDERALREFGDPQRLLFNVNSPADLERAEELIRERA